jgi:prepilin-type N-terminal cleavage/methylation domain-containing protein
MKPRLSSKKSNGFTLIELLVVIAIIAILAALLLPALASAKESGHSVKCLSNMRQVAMGIYMYKDDYDEHLPFAGSTDRNWHEDWVWGGPGDAVLQKKQGLEPVRSQRRFSRRGGIDFLPRDRSGHPPQKPDARHAQQKGLWGLSLPEHRRHRVGAAGQLQHDEFYERADQRCASRDQVFDCQESVREVPAAE